MSAGKPRSLFALSMLMSLASCGGGDGGESASPLPPQRGGGSGSTSAPPPGISTAAVLDRNSTRELAATAMAELDLADKPQERPYLPEIVQRAKAVVANVEDPCPGGGSMEEAQNLDDELTGTIEIAFRDCMHGGARQNGRLTIRIDRFDAAAQSANEFVLELHELTFGVGEFSAIAAGRAAVSRAAQGETTTLSMAARYLPDGLSSRLEDVAIADVSDSAGARQVSISGRLFHSAHGYVDVSTLEALRFLNAAAAAPSSGAIRLTGAQNATADISFGGERVRVSLDADADARVEAGLSATWLELRDTRNFPPAADAGADRTIEHGGTVTLDASASADWEGDALTYEWMLASRPAGSVAKLSGSSSSLSFRPDVPGTYELQVTVRDAEAASSDSVRLTVLPGGALPENQRPIANAGLDKVTVEWQPVTIDGSLTADPESDPLSYEWQLTRAPRGSAALREAVMPTFEFTPDLPGTYDLRLTAHDGRSGDTDTMRVIADRLLRFESGASFRIRGERVRGDDAAELRLRTSAHYRGPPVSVNVAANARWLRLGTAVTSSARAGDAALIRVELVLEEATKLRRGIYAAQIRATPSGGQQPAVANVVLVRR
jgi:hypothetical protein